MSAEFSNAVDLLETSVEDGVGVLESTGALESERSEDELSDLPNVDSVDAVELTQGEH